MPPNLRRERAESRSTRDAVQTGSRIASAAWNSTPRPAQAKTRKQEGGVIALPDRAQAAAPRANALKPQAVLVFRDWVAPGILTAELLGVDRNLLTDFTTPPKQST